MPFFFFAELVFFPLYKFSILLPLLLDIQAHARANYDYDIKKDTWSGKGEIGVSHAMFRFADDQDVRFTAGTQCSLSSRGITNPQPFVKFEENNWSLVVTSNGQRSSWRISYAL